MHKSEIKAVFLAVLLIAGTFTIVVHFNDVYASSDKKDQRDKKDSRDHDQRDKKDSRDHDQRDKKDSRDHDQRDKKDNTQVKDKKYQNRE